MTSPGVYRGGGVADADRRANPLGALLAIVGIAGFSVAVFLAWLGPANDTNVQGGDRAVSGYNLNAVIPFAALLGIGLAIALLYAQGKATRRQHRGLTLVTMAVGLAAFGLSVAYLVNPPGAAGRLDTASTKIGVFVALASAALWSLGAGLFATQIEGDDRTEIHQTTTTDTYPAGAPTGAVADPLATSTPQVTAPDPLR